MKESLSEPLTIDDMARTAMFSKFHFSRIFQRVTGLPPGKFLSALRLQEAKQLLMSTSLNVIDISHQVGYNSVGTFSTRFTSSVGISPTAYRRLGGFVPRVTVDDRSGAARRTSATVSGTVCAPDTLLGHTFIGLFPQPIPQGRPVSWTVLERPGPYLLDKAPEGSWFLLAHALRPDEENDPPAGDEQPYLLRHGPVQLRDNDDVTLPDLCLRPVRFLDPPVLLALPDIRLARRMAEARTRADQTGFAPPAPAEPCTGKPERDGNGGRRGAAMPAA
ncbi:helix-turn-helix transcriptional regulator [Dactylosporangium sp. NPDC005555]|uniref:helix-turn-helix transcriptional regulator n=1 Tax=Dactylosporangium sp. NPDC005555 TaxID=3154889 RepID=UPI0033A67DF5